MSSLVRFLFLNFLLLTLLTYQGLSQPAIDTGAHAGDARKLIDAALSDQASFDRLARFVDRFGHRFSGSESLEQSIDWIVDAMMRDGLESVHTQPVKVPHWVRGDEYAIMTSPRSRKLPMLGLGGSVGTPEEGIEAEVLVVDGFEDLKEHRAQAKGKIVLFDVPFTSYGETVRYRVSGAVKAAEAGAVASLIRSVTPYSLQTPHTGNSRYRKGVRKIPHAAITPEDASLLHRMQERGIPIRVKLFMEARTLPRTPSRNIVAEIKGSEKPEEIVVLGGHIDSWDVGQGAMDDAGGCFAAWEAVRLMKELGLRPKRTIRVVLWTNEENGLQGALRYRDIARKNETLDNHILVIESDSGVFDPSGFGFTGSDAALRIIREIGTLLNSLGSGHITRGGGGADIGPLMREGIPGMGLRVDGSRYFWYHHTDADTIDKLDEEEFKKCVATMAVMAYTVANLEQRLPR